MTGNDEEIGQAIDDAFAEFSGRDDAILTFAGDWTIRDAFGQRWTALEIGGPGSVAGWQFSKIG